MPSRQDQLHSHQHSLQRVVAALISHDPDPHRSPLRRTGTTVLAGMVIAALAVAGVAVHGLLTGHSSVQVRDESVVFLEKGSGARYVYLGSDARLHPVLNYTSGLLIATGGAPRVVGTSRQRLASVPLGDPLGIPDAPDSLPVKTDLRTGDWSVCTAATGAVPASTVLVGEPVTGGVVLGAGSALLVGDPAGRTFLVYGDTRFLVPPDRATAALRALGWNARQPWPVAAAFLNAIPLGPDLAAPTVPGFGEPSGLNGYPVGQLLTDGRQWSVALADGAAAVTDVQARLLRARPGAFAPRNLGDAFNHLVPSRTRLSDTGGLPAEVPELATPAQRVCMTLPVRDTGAGIRVDPPVPAGAPVRGAAAVPGGVQADFVHVARGRGALVVAAASPSAPAGSGTVSVVTDTGRRFPVASRDLLGRLGYGGVTPQQVPAQLVTLLPQGPALDPEQARRPVTGPGR